MAVIVRGYEWRPFDVEFDTAEGRFSFHLFALNLQHAQERLEELKATARVTGEIFGIYPAGGN